MTQAHLDLQSQLDFQNLSNISDPTTTPLCIASQNLVLSPIQLVNHTVLKQMETTNTVSESPYKSDDTPPQTFEHRHLRLLNTNTL